MDVKALSEYHGIVRLDDWAGLDKTGVTNMSAIVQQWQDQAVAANRIAVAPGNALIRLNSKVTFKAPTRGTLGMGGAASTSGVRSQSTVFMNGGINDGSWLIEIPTDVAANYNFHMMADFRIFNDATLYTCAGMRALGALGVGAMQSWLWSRLVAYGFTVNLESYGWGGVLNEIVSRQASITCMRMYQANACTIAGGWYGSGKTGGSDFELIGDRISTTAGFGGVTFRNTVFQPESITGVSHGLRISEAGHSIKVDAYFESHRGNSTTKAWAIDVGSFASMHPSPDTGPTALSFNGEIFTGANAPNYAPGRSVKGLDLSSTIISSGGGGTNANLGPRVRIDNVTSVTFGDANVGAKEVLLTGKAVDINGIPHNLGISSPSSDGRHSRIEYYGSLIIVDELNRVGRPAINILPPGNFAGSGPQALRGAEFSGLAGGTASGRVTWNSDAAITYDGKPTLKVVRTGDSTAAVGKMYLFPFGSTDKPIPDGSYITISGMIRVKSAAGYDASPVGSTETTMAYPGIGIAYTDGGGTFASPSSLGYADADGAKYFKVDTWVPFFHWWRVDSGPITRLGLSITPIASSNYVPTVDHQINLANLAICINPLSFTAVRNGQYLYSDKAGTFVGDNFHVTSAVPSGGGTYAQVGDVFWVPTPAAGGSIGKVCTTAGSPGATKDFGVIAL